MSKIVYYVIAHDPQTNAGASVLYASTVQERAVLKSRSLRESGCDCYVDEIDVEDLDYVPVGEYNN